jgi:hypothetical protein
MEALVASKDLEGSDRFLRWGTEEDQWKPQSGELSRELNSELRNEEMRDVKFDNARIGLPGYQSSDLRFSCQDFQINCIFRRSEFLRL